MLTSSDAHENFFQTKGWKRESWAGAPAGITKLRFCQDTQIWNEAFFSITFQFFRSWSGSRKRKIALIAANRSNAAKSIGLATMLRIFFMLFLVYKQRIAIQDTILTLKNSTESKKILTQERIQPLQGLGHLVVMTAKFLTPLQKRKRSKRSDGGCRVETWSLHADCSKANFSFCWRRSYLLLMMIICQWWVMQRWILLTQIK